MQRLINRFIFLSLFLFSIVLVYFSFNSFNTLAKLQNLVNRLNQTSQNQTNPVNTAAQLDLLVEFEGLHDKLPWDADIGSMLITVVNNRLNEIDNKGQQQFLASKIQKYYQQSLSLRPRDIQLLSGRLDLLIDQGAPAEYILPKLDEIITLVPKDQDLKAELAMICFKLLALNPQPVAQTQIINSLKNLFDYSMDYRGLIHVRRYARLYGQDDVLKNLLSKLN